MHADLGLHCPHMPKDTFSHGAAINKYTELSEDFLLLHQMRTHNIAPDKMLFYMEKNLFFSYFSKETYVVGTH